MARIAIARLIRECPACGEPATAGKYCHACDVDVARGLDELNGRMSTALYERPQGGETRSTGTSS